MTEKKYEYIPQLMNGILARRVNTLYHLKDKRVLGERHPKCKQATIVTNS